MPGLAIWRVSRMRLWSGSSGKSSLPIAAATCSRRRVAPDEDWRHDPKLLSAYLERLQTFVDRLAPAHNSLKAHVLYHRLVLDRQQGKYDKGKVLAYLKL